MIKALDFTKKGEDEDIDILYAGGKAMTIKKKFLEPTELFEYGVYNSETDANSNPKTGENKPDMAGAVVTRVTERLKEIAHSLDELRVFIKDNSALSHDSLDKCISEITSYVKSLDNENQEAASAIVN